MAYRMSGNDPRQGSAFNELVFNPTFRPDIARPYHLPGTPEFAAAQAALQQELRGRSEQVNGDASTESSDNAAVAPPATQPADIPQVEATQVARQSSLDTLFFVLVTIEYTKPSKQGSTTRGNARPSRTTESHNTASQVQVLRMNRQQFMHSALSAFNLQNVYDLNGINGPSFKICWSGSVGGQTRAPTVSNNDGWASIKSQLQAAVDRPRSKLDTVSVTFDLDAMDKFKNAPYVMLSANMASAAAQPALNGDPLSHAAPELAFGTHVPTADSFTPQQQACATAAAEIRAHWACEQHGDACYVQADSTHVQLNRLRLNSWACAIVAGNCVASDPPPADLLLTWTGGAAGVGSSISKPRGRTGPRSASIHIPPAPTSVPTTSDSTSLLFASVATLM
ncbi:hypothetical protein CVT24_011091, partial [Panaeolus cyanescens]